MSDEIQPGDVVELRSGGLRMTVQSISNAPSIRSNTGDLWCVWTYAGEKRTDSFPRHVLRKIVD